jgi:hypothetical protein
MELEASRDTAAAAIDARARARGDLDGLPIPQDDTRRHRHCSAVIQAALDCRFWLVEDNVHGAAHLARPVRMHRGAPAGEGGQVEV